MAKITYSHAGDHAVVAFSGELDWDASRELVDVIDVLVDDYFYTEVELVVASPGGNVRAFEHYLVRQEGWRRRGVTLRTRIFSEASSAAAVLVCLGDERVAEPGSTLSFHGTQVCPDTGVDARTTATMTSVLEEADETTVGRLADRALKSEARVPHDAVRADVRLLQQLWPEFGRSRKGGKVPCKPRKLAQALGRYVDQAVRGRDRKALRSLYRRLIATEGTLSAPLARSFRLVDRVGAGAEAALDGRAPDGLTVPEWGVLFPPDGTVPREVLCRHALVLGETGSGKTASCILPVAAAMARAPRETLASALIIDPKRELARTLRRIAPARVHEVRADRVVLDVMSGPRWSLEDDLAARRWVSAARRILGRVASFVPASPAGVLVRHQAPASGNNKDFFDREGASLALTLLAFVLMVIDPRTPAPEAWLGDGDDVDAYVWVEDLLGRARTERGPNVVGLAAWCLDGRLMAAPPLPRSRPLHTADEVPPLHVSQWLFARIARAALRWLCGESPQGRDVCERIAGYWASMVEVDRQFAGVRGTASVVCADFSSPAIASTLYFGCEPGYRAARSEGNGLDFAQLVAPDAPGTLVVFQPSRDQLDNLVAVALKAGFFEGVLDDPDRARGGSDLPLVGYVADEFHRFVTSDPLHGEQSFLDTCRSFGAFCVLACQSVASIEHALAHGGGSDTQNRASVEILLSNTATKFVFRSTHRSTAERVAELAPRHPGLPGVGEVRPVSSLGVGEAYVALSDGRFERRQLQPFVAPDPAQASHVSCIEGPIGQEVGGDPPAGTATSPRAVRVRHANERGIVPGRSVVLGPVST